MVSSKTRKGIKDAGESREEARQKLCLAQAWQTLAFRTNLFWNIATIILFTYYLWALWWTQGWLAVTKSWVGVTETVWPTKLKVLNVWPFIETLPIPGLAESSLSLSWGNSRAWVALQNCLTWRQGTWPFEPLHRADFRALCLEGSRIWSLREVQARNINLGVVRI